MLRKIVKKAGSHTLRYTNQSGLLTSVEKRTNETTNLNNAKSFCKISKMRANLLPKKF
jgi:hypothetical protein